MESGGGAGPGLRLAAWNLSYRLSVLSRRVYVLWWRFLDGWAEDDDGGVILPAFRDGEESAELPLSFDLGVCGRLLAAR